MTVTVSDPRTDDDPPGSGRNRYTSYQVNVATNVPGYGDKREFSVRRRFNDFAALYKLLSVVAKAKFTKIPDLPPKTGLVEGMYSDPAPCVRAPAHLLTSRGNARAPGCPPQIALRRRWWRRGARRSSGFCRPLPRMQPSAVPTRCSASSPPGCRPWTGPARPGQQSAATAPAARSSASRPETEARALPGNADRLGGALPSFVKTIRSGQ